ncbi:MAG: signal peptidase I [Methanobacteriaceae archaeon]|jgi:signal peptidase|nr:signal peptidase I [Methanobacteriaceae archaeon]MDO9628243.1 signal peptidase I [Methanobacteriaceae archaeon]
MDDNNQIKEIAIYIAIIIIGVIAAQHMNVVVSGSMEPVFYRGDIVLVEKANFLGIHEFNPEDVKKGDIVIYNANWFPDPVIHRVVATGTAKNGTKYYIIKGDNNPVPDPAVVYPSQITARVITIGTQPLFIPRIGYITLWIRGL